MKKVIFVFAALLLLISLGCAKTAAPEASVPAVPDAEQATAAPEPITPQPPAAEEATPVPEEPTEPDEPVTEPTTDILVVYFSRTGEQYNVGVIDEGNTAIVAKMIAEETSADLYEILPEEDYYPYTYRELTDAAKKEQNENARPAIREPLPDLAQYDTIFIGAPVWWGDWPMILYTFFEGNAEALKGKTLIPFSTHEGSGLSGFDKKLQKACPDSTVLKGLAVAGQDAQNDRERTRQTVHNWLLDLG